MTNDMFLTENEFSRPARKLKGVKGVVIHWTGNPGSSAKANRAYFESLKTQKQNAFSRYASAHYIVGLEGEIIHCIPDDEMAYHVGSSTYMQKALENLSTYPNNCTIGIEMCCIDSAGHFNKETVEATVSLVKELLVKHNLSKKDIYRHFDITGKVCPRLYVEQEGRWQEFLSQI